MVKSVKFDLYSLTVMLIQLGLKQVDLYLIHFPVSLEYVDPAHRYPPEWWGDDKKTVTLGKHEPEPPSKLKFLIPPLANVPYQETWKAL